MRIPRWLRPALALALVFAVLPAPAAAQKATVPLGTAAQFLPPDTALYLAVDSDHRSPQLQQLQRIVTYYARAGSFAEVEQMALDAIPDPALRQLVADLDTWVGGEVFLAVTDASGLRDVLAASSAPTGPAAPLGPAMGIEPVTMASPLSASNELPISFLAGVAVGDLAAFSRWTQRFHAELGAHGVPTTTERYRNTDILTISSRQHSAFVAMYANYVLISTDRETLTGAIDRSAAASLASSPSFRAALATFLGRPLAFWYTGDFWEALGLSQLPLYAGFSPPGISWTAGVLRLDTQSVRIDATTVFDLTRITPAVAASFNQRANPLRTASIVPPGSTVYLGLDNLKQMWDQLAELGGPIAEELPGLRLQIRAATGLDLEDDVFGWMTGETALFVAPSGVDDDLQGFGIGLVVEARDPAAAAARVSRIMAALQRLSDPSLSIESIEVEGATFERVTLSPRTSLYGGVVGNWAMIATSPVNVAESMMGIAFPGGLTSQPDYLRTRTNLPGQVQSLMYLHVRGLADQIMDAARVSARDRLEAEYYLRPLGGVAISSSASGNRSNANVYIQLVIP